MECVVIKKLVSAWLEKDLVKTRALWDGLFDFGGDRDRFFAQMSVFGHDQYRFRD
jgi:hypothetical protein